MVLTLGNNTYYWTMEEINKMKYDANFTAGGLLFEEFLALKEILLGNDLERQLKIEESQNQYMGISTLGARKRILPQVKKRVHHAPKGFWEQFYQWEEKEQKLGLFYICLETYKLIFDIHWEVAIVKYKTGNELDSYDLSMFLDEIASKDEDVSSWSFSTFEKLNTRYRRALQEAGLLTKKRLHQPQGISNSFWDYFKINNKIWFLEACFIA